MSRANGIGCKGGTSATAGKKSVKFSFLSPDGKAMTGRTFKIAADDEGPFIALFYASARNPSEWHFNTVVRADDERAWVMEYKTGYRYDESSAYCTTVPATKIG